MTGFILTCFVLQGGGNMRHPGLILPEVVSSTQGLFGPGPKKVGTPRSLRVSRSRKRMTYIIQSSLL